jgi:hypothetical protein
MMVKQWKEAAMLFEEVKSMKKMRMLIREIQHPEICTYDQ